MEALRPELRRLVQQHLLKEWGERNDTQVIVDNVGLDDIANRAAAEAAAQQGHDLVILLAPAAVHEDQVIDHREIYEECERRYGGAPDYAIKSTYNPRTDLYFGFCSAVLPPLLTYRKDLWDAGGATPDSWDDVRRGGGRSSCCTRVLWGSASPRSPTATIRCDHNVLLRVSGPGCRRQSVLKSKQTIDAIKYVKALYEEAMTEEVLTWNPTSIQEIERGPADRAERARRRRAGFRQGDGGIPRG
jgi:multiple sugar transport system substrate-binding protein